MLVALGICAVVAAPSDVDVRSFVDSVRRQHGLAPVRANAQLQRAAESHVAYMLANESAGHGQREGAPRFTGRTPGDRARHFGYIGPNSEAVAWGDLDERAMLQGLFDAPYHRVLFLQPGTPDFGGSSQNGAICVKFGGRTSDATVVSPANGARGVSPLWDGVESPSPLRQTNVNGPVGYPVVLAAFGQDAKEFRSINAVLVGPKGPVRSVVLAPGSDPYARDCVIIVPLAPLAKRTTYTATFTYANSGRERTSRTSFTTAG